jgi:transmembrane sensor
MDSARLTYLFHRYINQTCTEDERNEFLLLISQPDYEVQVKDLMKDLWNTVQQEEGIPLMRTEKMLEEIWSADEQETLDSRRFFFPAWSKVAAMLALMVCSAVIGYYILRPENTKTLAEQSSAPAEHQIIKLPDGSIVVLNAGSTLQFPESFKGKLNREVTLTGEGYFDIIHDLSQPFIVHTGNLSTTVLGTAFNIKAYPQANDITVTVTRGKVKVSDEKKVIGIITPDQQIKFDKLQQKSQQQQVDSRVAIAWSDKDIFFDDITLADVALALEQRFHIAITFDNEAIKACRLTATFVRGEDLNQILTVICEFNGSHFTRDAAGNILIQGGAGC